MLESEKTSFSKKFFDNKGIIFITLGFTARIIMLIYFYMSSRDPSFSYGDVGLGYNMVMSLFDENIANFFNLPYEYPPLSIYLLTFFKTLSFGSIELFAFYNFLLELLTLVLFYFVLKKFGIEGRLWVFGLFLINPFVFLNNVFSLVKWGYQITDYFFWLFLLGSLYFYPKEDKSFFYLFSGLAMSIKWFTLPAAVYFFLKFLLEKDWKELKKLVIFLGIPIFIFLISPIFYFPDYLGLYLYWLGESDSGSFFTPQTLFKIMIFGAIFIGYLLLRIKKANLLEITFASIIVMFSIMVWSRQYLRYLTPLILYGHLISKREFFELNINLNYFKFHLVVDNNILTFIISIFACLGSFMIIIFVFRTPII